MKIDVSINLIVLPRDDRSHQPDERVPSRTSVKKVGILRSDEIGCALYLM